MTNNKLTPEEIIKALECCSGESPNCSDCPANKYEAGKCFDIVKVQAVAVMNNQQEELESIRLSLGLMNKRKYYRKFVDEVFRKEKGKELSTPDFDYIYELYFKQQAEIEQWKEEANRYQTLWCEDVQIARAEAIKEFAERLKDRCNLGGEIYGEDIDNLVKEMVGDDK